MRHVCPECGDPGEVGICATDRVARVPAGADALLGTTIGSWRVASVIGTGGMGRVYKAVQPAIGARVAIKVLKRECAADPDLVERFFNEARAVNLIRHDNIVDVIDLGRLPDGAPYIVMEFLEGASLAALFARGRQDPAHQLPVGALARLVGEVLAALAAAHAKGIIHRDLKPDNVFVSPGGRITVLDFGIAKLATTDGSHPTQTGSLLGTPAYMSPEQARAQPLDARTDLYSAGVILYEGATGGLPFIAASLYELLDLQVKAAPPAPRTKRPDLPAPIEAVILRALAKDPADRFATATDMRRALDEATAGMPSEQLAFPSITLAAPPGPPSDPFAATAAATHGSLARGETMPSTPPEAPRPAVQRSRRTPALLAIVGVAALAGGALVLLRRSASSSAPATTPPPPALPADADQITLARPLRGELPPVDAAVVVPALPADAPVAITRAADAGHRAPPVTPASLVDGSMPLHVADLHAFDPSAYTRTVTDLATRATGKVVLTGATWLGIDRRGRIDLARPHAAAHYVFVAVDRVAAKDPYCSVLASFEQGAGTLSVGRSEGSEGGECHGRPITLHCSAAALWQRAVAQGLPTAASAIGANYISGYWHLSSADAPDFDPEVPDDCP